MQQLEAIDRLSAGALSAYGFTPEDIERVQAALYKLLTSRTARFTMGDSSSVPVETAENLFRSVCFSIGLYLQNTGNIAALRTDDYDALLKRAWETLESEIARGKLLLRQALITAPDVKSRAYGDTLRSIGGFFKRYDYRFLAHEIPASIDYPLCHAVSEEALGISYINAYLERLNIENDFCGHFSASLMHRLLTSVSPDYGELLINLYEPVAVNAVARALLGLDVLPLDVTEDNRAQLAALLSEAPVDTINMLLTKATENICQQLAIASKTHRQYLLQTALNLTPRIQATEGKYSYLFPTLFNG